MAASPWRRESSEGARGPEEGWWREDEKITAEGRQSCWGGRGSGPAQAGGSFFCGMARQTDIQTGCPVGKEAEVRGVKRKKAKIKKTMHRRKSFSCSDTVSGSDIAEPAQEKGASLLASTRTRGRRWSRTAFVWTRCVCVFVLCVLLCPCCLRRGLGHTNTTGQQRHLCWPVVVPGSSKPGCPSRSGKSASDGTATLSRRRSDYVSGCSFRGYFLFPDGEERGRKGHFLLSCFVFAHDYRRRVCSR